jgi:glycosyltransferase involved in cell wall biosynthesis
MQAPDPAAILVDRFPASQRSLRVACVTETYPPEVNGVAITLAQVVDGLHRRNNEVQLIRPRQVRDEAAGREHGFQEVLMRGMPIPRYPNLRMGLPAKGALVQEWSRHRPDIVHIATEGPLGWSALQAARQLKLPVSSDFRTNFHAYSRHYGMGWLHKPIMAYLRKFHNHAQCTMVPTEALRRDLERDGFRQVTVVSRGVDTARFSPQKRSQALRNQWGVEEDDLVVVCIGRLAPEKNLATLTSAWREISGLDARAKLVFVGEGPMRAQLQAEHPDAIFAGQRGGDDLAAHYASADLLLFPSLTETFGNVTTEALASGLPVVAFDYAAAAQLICENDNGALVPYADTAAYVRAALALAINPALRRTMGVAARASVASLSWNAIVARFEATLCRVIHETDLRTDGAFIAAGQAIG